MISKKGLKKKAITVFNKWIRERDKNLTCISCNGKVEQAGHYFHGHLYEALRFSEMNVNGQCVQCNYAKAGNEKEYRKGLVRRYGEGNVILLENTANLRGRKTWTTFELELIIKNYDIRN